MGADEDAGSCNRLKEGVLLGKCGWAHRADKASGCDIIRQDMTKDMNDKCDKPQFMT